MRTKKIPSASNLLGSPKKIRYNHPEQYESLTNEELRETASREAVAEYCSDMLRDSKVMEKMIEENPTFAQKVINVIKNAIKRLHELYKRAFKDYNISKENINILKDTIDDYQALVDKWDKAVKEGIKHQNARAAVKGNDIKNKIAYSIKDTVVSDEGTEFHNVVYLDTNIFNGVKPRNWGNVLIRFIKNNLIGKQILTKDEKGKTKVIEFAKTNERVTKEGAKNSHKVIDKLARKKDNISKLAVAHSVELIEVSEFNESNSDNNHQWLDENGWEYREAYLIDIKGNIFSATLNIAKTRDNRNILYDINKINNIGHGVVPSNANGKRGSLINPNVATDNISQTAENINKNTAQKSSKGFVQNQDRDLVAVHNLTAEEFEKSLNLGGFPMPSIAVTKDDFLHKEYGDISVIFSRDTIDPKRTAANKVYGGDAWTPSYPQVEYKINSKKASEAFFTESVTTRPHRSSSSMRRLPSRTLGSR